METITTHELLERSARAALKLQREDGSFPPGRNGVYDEPETPVRTTSHWLTTLSKVYEITGDEEFAEAANDAADYLLSDEVRPYGYTFHSRNAEGKDKCDGLVGQSGAIRSLARSGAILKRPELTETAASVFSLHPFEDRIGLWERVEITGQKLSFDRTLNHQIFFAGAGSYLADNYPAIDWRVECFLDNLVTNLRIHDNGLVKHFVRPHIQDVLAVVSRAPRRKNLAWNEIVFHYYSRSDDHRFKEVGYHPVVLVGLSALKRNYPNHRVWKHEKLKRAVEYIESGTYSNERAEMDEQYGAMVPALVLARVKNVFCEVSENVIKSLVAEGLATNYNFDSNTLTKDSNDSAYQAAQIRHLVNLPNISVQYPHRNDSH